MPETPGGLPAALGQGNVVAEGAGRDPLALGVAQHDGNGRE